MASIYTLTLSPSLDSATMTPQIYPEGKLRCSAPVLSRAAAASTWRALLPISAEKPPPSSRWRRHGRTSGGVAGR